MLKIKLQDWTYAQVELGIIQKLYPPKSANTNL